MKLVCAFAVVGACGALQRSHVRVARTSPRQAATMVAADSLRFMSEAQALQVREEFGTPTFVYDAGLLRQRAADALAFPNAFGVTVRYAMKACPNVAASPAGAAAFLQMSLFLESRPSYGSTQCARGFSLRSRSTFQKWLGRARLEAQPAVRERERDTHTHKYARARAHTNHPSLSLRRKRTPLTLSLSFENTRQGNLREKNKERDRREREREPLKIPTGAAAVRCARAALRRVVDVRGSARDGGWDRREQALALDAAVGL